MYVLNKELFFPDPSSANEEGLLAIGGDLSIDRLKLAFSNGIFPWFEDDNIILWWSPDPRFVLFPENLKVSKSMRQVLRKEEFKITYNQNFAEVIIECAQVKREGQHSTWITQGMMEAYNKLHELGYAKSVEVWRENELVGGLYGVDIGNKVFCGESMFSKKSNASKIGLIHLVQEGNYKLIDCQIYTSHLESLGAEEITRNQFIKLLN